MIHIKQIIVFLLCLSLLLGISGCGQKSVTGDDPNQTVTEATVSENDTLPDYHFSKMEYVRPDAQAVLTAQEACKTAAQSGSWDQLSAAVMEYLNLYRNFSTMHELAAIHYRLDLANSDWEAEFGYCSEQLVTISAGHERLGYTLSATDFADRLESEEYFGENGLLFFAGKNYITEEVEALLQEEVDLQNQYYSLTEFSTHSSGLPYDELGELLAQLVKLRKKIAAAAGFDSYADFANDYLYHRDYSSSEVRSYLDQVKTQIAGILVQQGYKSPVVKAPVSGSAFTYVKELTQKAGGTIAEAFEIMEAGQLYDIGFSEAKFGAAFATYLPNYQVPYIFIKPMGESVAVTLTHEFGHFCKVFADRDMGGNVDTAEIYSQGLEYMAMFYADGTQNDAAAYSLLLCYVTTAAQADFELRLYELPEEEVTTDNIIKLYSQVGSDWGLTYVASFGKQSLLGTQHYYLTPMYMLSYSISGDAALQLYDLEVQKSGAGMACYEILLQSKQVQLLPLLEETGLRSPFEPGAIEKSRDTFMQLFKKNN